LRDVIEADDHSVSPAATSGEKTKLPPSLHTFWICFIGVGTSASISMIRTEKFSQRLYFWLVFKRQKDQKAFM
jgi:hypothetical protein